MPDLINPLLRVKICGNTTREDAERADALGADFLGFIFHPPSPRAVTAAQVREILTFERTARAIGVFVNWTPDQIAEAVAEAGLDGVQLHGDESPEMCEEVPGFRIKAIRVKDEASLDPVDDYHTEAVLADAHVEGVWGGSGQSFDHALVQDLARRRSLFLAGGLTPENVAEAAAYVRPFAVDVASGVEAEPGRKDAAKLEKFFAALSGAGLR